MATPRYRSPSLVLPSKNKQQDLEDEQRWEDEHKFNISNGYVIV